jgi:hypothetical protein
LSFQADKKFDFAMVHAAMHDAVQAFDGRFEPYNVAIPNASAAANCEPRQYGTPDDFAEILAVYVTKGHDEL